MLIEFEISEGLNEPAQDDPVKQGKGIRTENHTIIDSLVNLTAKVIDKFNG